MAVPNKRRCQVLVPSKKRLLRGSDGFTVTEVVVSALIMMIVCVAIYNCVSFARRSGSVSENQLACLHIARATLEKLVVKSYASTNLAVGTHPLPNNRGNYVVTEDGTGDGRTKNITVTINWVEPTGMRFSVSLMTSLSRSLHK